MGKRDEPALVRVIPVNRRVRFASGAVVVGSVEVWADGITVLLTHIRAARVRGEAFRPGGVRLHDDVGTAYLGRGGGGGGNLQVLHCVSLFGPAPPADASTLYVSVEWEGGEVEIDVPLAPATPPGR